MSCIMTANGWHQLSPFPAPEKIEEAPPRYRGPLPSVACLAYIKELETAHNEWLEVVRLRAKKGA